MEISLKYKILLITLNSVISNTYYNGKKYSDEI
jgi:hypothetical protein